MSLPPPHPEMVLSFPSDGMNTSNIDANVVLQTLTKQQQFALHVPFRWTYIDKPKDGDFFLLCLPGHKFPVDGLVFLDKENQFTLQNQNNAFDIQCFENKSGFIPGVDQVANRVRRRFHFSRGNANPFLYMVHYSRGNPTPIPTQYMGISARNYPLPPVSAPWVFVAGPRANQTVSEEEGRMLAANVPETKIAAPQSRTAAMAQDAHAQAANLAALSGKVGTEAHRRDEEDSGDEENISLRTLALSRYKRNHELMEEVLYHAAFGKGTVKVEEPQSLDMTGIEAKIVAAEAEIDRLTKEAAARKAAREAKEEADMIQV